MAEMKQVCKGTHKQQAVRKNIKYPTKQGQYRTHFFVFDTHVLYEVSAANLF